MFIHPDASIFDLTAMPSMPTDGQGYLLNIKPDLMADDLAAFVVTTPKTPWITWHDDQPAPPPVVVYEDGPMKGRMDKQATMKAMADYRPVYSMICLRFPDEAAARASSLGDWWQEPAIT